MIDMKNNLVRGVRKASDFLMALQLTGAFKRDALPNLQARLPAVVIGGGLTGIDTATELFAYYPMQVEKTLDRYEALVRGRRRGRGSRACTTPRNSAFSTSSSRTAAAVRAERGARAAAGERRTSCRWSAAGAASRWPTASGMTDSPAYRLNHEEVIKALEEGIWFAGEPRPDARSSLTSIGHARSLVFKGSRTDRRAAGTDGPGRRRHVAEHHLREGAARDVPARR